MSTLFGSIHIGARSLMAQLSAMRVIGHNIANANTQGYTRQEVVLQSGVPDMTSVGPIGTGVETVGVRQIRDGFVEARLRSGMETLAQWEKKSEILGELEMIFAEPSDTGLAATMTEFWNRWRDLAGNPEEHGLRVSVIEQGTTMANTFQRIHSDLEGLQENLDETLELSATEVNTYLRQIAALNDQIQTAEMSGGVATDLRDRRQVLLQQLSTFMDVRTEDAESADLRIISHGQFCIDGGHYMQLVVERNSDTGMREVHWDETGVDLVVESGSIYSALEGRDSTIVSYMDDLSELARDIVLAVNRVHSSGRGTADFSSITSGNVVNDTAVALSNMTETGLANAAVSGSFQLLVTDSNGHTETYTIPILDGMVESLDDLAQVLDGAGVPNMSASISSGRLTMTADAGYTFAFANDTSDVLCALGINTFFTGSGADDMAVASAVAGDPRLVAAGLSSDPGDGSNARAMAALEDSLTMSSGRWSFADYYRDMVVGLGVAVQETGRFAEGQEAVLDELVQRREAISGVSVDEESANIIKYQRAYEASAQFIAAVSEMIEYMLLQLT